MTSGRVLARLTSERKLKRQPADLGYLNDMLAAAERNFKAARLVEGKVDEAAFKLYYDGLLQVCRVIVLLSGYRPDDGEQHRTTFLAAGEILGPEYEELLGKIQRFRVKRNDCLYSPRGLIGRAEVAAIHQAAQDFWSKVRSYLQKANPQLKLFREAGEP